MKITQEVREYAVSHAVDAEEALVEGMREKAEQFRQGGAEIYTQG